MSRPTSRGVPEKTERLYRVIRAFKGAFAVQDIAALAETGLTRARNLLCVLETQGFVQRAGQQGNKMLWLVTKLGRENTTLPKIVLPGDGFKMERRAVVRLAEIFISAADLSNSRTAENIREQLEVLNRRFALKGDSNDS